jgi:hypothetical protein
MSDVSDPQQAIARLVAQYRRRLIARAAGLGLLAVGCWGVALWRVAGRVQDSRIVGAGAGLGVALCGWVWWLMRRQTRQSRQAVDTLDRQLRMDARLLTAAEFADRPVRPLLYDALLQDVGQTLAGASRRMPRVADWRTGLLALALLLAILWPMRPLPTLDQLARATPPSLTPPQPPPPEPAASESAPQSAGGGSQLQDQGGSGGQGASGSQSSSGSSGAGGESQRDQSDQSSSPRSQDGQGQGQSPSQQGGGQGAQSSAGQQADASNGQGQGQGQSGQSPSQGAGSGQGQQAGAGGQSADQSGSDPRGQSGQQEHAAGGQQPGSESGSGERSGAESEASQQASAKPGQQGQRDAAGQGQSAQGQSGQNQRMDAAAARRALEAAKQQQRGGGQGSQGQQAKPSAGEGAQAEALKQDIKQLLQELSGEVKDLQAQLTDRQQEVQAPGTSGGGELYGEREPSEAPEATKRRPVQLEVDTEGEAVKRPGSGLAEQAGEAGEAAPQLAPEDATLAPSRPQDTVGTTQRIPPEYRPVFERLSSKSGAPAASAGPSPSVKE